MILFQIVKIRILSISIIAASFWLSADQAIAQVFNEHYIAGTEGIKAGTLPSPGIYFDDINLFNQFDANGSSGNFRVSTYIIEPRFRWISETKILGANYGLELMLPLVFQRESAQLPVMVGFPFSGLTYQLRRFQVNDLEVSPLLLSWHLKHFDFTASYAFWVPTDDNSYTTVTSPTIPTPFPAQPPQMHWWGHMITLGGTWYPDADRKWAVSAATHYEINQSFDIGTESMEYGQRFTTQWSVSRKSEKYFELGVIGAYSRQTTSTSIDSGSNQFNSFDTHPTIEIGPEFKVIIPQFDFHVSIRYLRQLNNPDENTGYGSYNVNVIALTLSKRF